MAGFLNERRPAHIGVEVVNVDVDGPRSATVERAVDGGDLTRLNEFLNCIDMAMDVFCCSLRDLILLGKTIIGFPKQVLNGASEQLRHLFKLIVSCRLRIAFDSNDDASADSELVAKIGLRKAEPHSFRSDTIRHKTLLR